MLSTVAGLVTRQPQRVLQHLQGYAELAGVEASIAGRAIARRAAWTLAGLLGATVTLTLLGAATLLWLVHATAPPPLLGWVWAVPAVPALLSVAALWWAHRLPMPDAFDATRRQLGEDLRLLEALQSS